MNNFQQSKNQATQTSGFAIGETADVRFFWQAAN